MVQRVHSEGLEVLFNLCCVSEGALKIIYSADSCSVCGLLSFVPQSILRPAGKKNEDTSLALPNIRSKDLLTSCWLCNDRPKASARQEILYLFAPYNGPG